jgi:hypothetical protein
MKDLSRTTERLSNRTSARCSSSVSSRVISGEMVCLTNSRKAEATAPHRAS